MSTKTPPSLETVLERPTDKAARLVHADWLLEMGDLHGELIALQCAHDLPAQSSDVHAPAPEGRKREWTLLRKISKTWLAPYRPALRFWTWHRGFVGAVQARASKLLAATDPFTAATPLLECVFEDSGRATFPLLAETRMLARVRRLKLFGDGGAPSSTPLRATELGACRSQRHRTFASSNSSIFTRRS